MGDTNAPGEASAVAPRGLAGSDDSIPARDSARLRLSAHDSQVCLSAGAAVYGDLAGARPIRLVTRTVQSPCPPFLAGGSRASGWTNPRQHLHSLRKHVKKGQYNVKRNQAPGLVEARCDGHAQGRLRQSIRSAGALRPHLPEVAGLLWLFHYGEDHPRPRGGILRLRQNDRKDDRCAARRACGVETALLALGAL